MKTALYLFLGLCSFWTTGRVMAENAETIAWRINVPLFELSDASIEESIRALAAKGRALDPAHGGVNFVWPADLSAETRLNLRLANVPLREAARYLGQLAGLQLTAGRHALVFTLPKRANLPVRSRFSTAASTAAELIVSRVELRDASLGAALIYLEAAARRADPKRQGVNIVADIPPETRERKITLSLTQVPFSEALRYLAELADLVVVEESYALVLTAAAPKPTFEQ